MHGIGKNSGKGRDDMLYGTINGIFGIMFMLIFFMIIAAFIAMAVRGFGEWNSNNQSPRYVTFQVESGDRMEFCVPGKEYGMLAEGDTGKLMFQGTRYLGFERE